MVLSLLVRGCGFVSSAPANLKGLEDLLESGYSLSIVNGHLVVNDVWYLDSERGLAKAHLAAPLTLIDESKVGAPINHQMFWSGAPPFYADRTAIALGARSARGVNFAGTSYPWHLSNKDKARKFATYTELVEHYVALIAGPAEQEFGVTARTGAIYEVAEEDSPFKVHDTFSARAQITDLNALLAEDKIAIIGLGGTGSFVLDFMVKTPVYSIDAFDFDVFAVHNGFRSPGEVPFDFFGQPKTAFYQHKYKDFRHRLNFHHKRVEAGDEAFFSNITFAFVCIDDGESRDAICKMLTALKLPFIDVGMGVEREGGRLDGLIRTTLFTEETAALAINDVPVDEGANEDIYRKLVQIGELNALNAVLAVLRYKQLRGFYGDDVGYYNTLFSIASSKLLGAK